MSQLILLHYSVSSMYLLGTWKYRKEKKRELRSVG